jgi:8-oxo-dGTP pyrophosphatase MutT (NUDIX family)
MPQPVVRSTRDRSLATYPASVLVFVLDEAGRILLLRSPRRRGWEVISGAFEADETALDAAMRELREEAGAQIRVRPLGVLHASTFYLDAMVPLMLSIAFVMRYEGGQVLPGDDMAGSEIWWATSEELTDNDVPIVAPGEPELRWLFQRAPLYANWIESMPPAALQPDLAIPRGDKYLE